MRRKRCEMQQLKSALVWSWHISGVFAAQEPRVANKHKSLAWAWGPGRHSGRNKDVQDRKRARWEGREGGRHGSVLLAGLEAARTVLIPTSLKLWPNQAWNQEQRDSRDWRELDSHCLNPGGVCTRVCVCEWVSVHVCTKQLRCCTCLF